MVEGGCLCGKIRYKFNQEDVISAGNCHCKDCQKATGSGKATIIYIPSDKLSINEDYKIYSVIGYEGSNVHRGFCPKCGSPIISYVTEQPEFKFIKAGTLDDSSWLELESCFWSDTANHWDPVFDNLEIYKKNPPM